MTASNPPPPPTIVSATYHTTPNTLVLVFSEPCQYSTLAADRFRAHHISNRRRWNSAQGSPWAGTSLTLGMPNQTLETVGTPVLDYLGTEITATATGLPLATFTNGALTVVP